MFRKRRERTELLGRLAMLGSTGDEVARTLEGLGIQGLWFGGDAEDAPEHCPVAYHLRRQYNVSSVWVCEDYIRVGKVQISTPGIIREFFDRYDAGLYPAARRAPGRNR